MGTENFFWFGVGDTLGGLGAWYLRLHFRFSFGHGGFMVVRAICTPHE